MNTRLRLLIGVLLFYSFFFLLSIFIYVSPSFAAVEVVDLGTLGGSFSKANAINNNGQVTGVSQTSTGAEHAFLWQDGVMQDLGVLGITEYFTPGPTTTMIERSEGMDINDKGEIVGQTSYDHYSYYQMKDPYQSFIWKDGVMHGTDLSGGEFNLVRINNSSVEAGTWNGSKSDPRYIAFRSQGQQPEFLTGVSQNSSFAYAINNNGQIVVCSLEPDGSKLFLWDNGNKTLITPGDCQNSSQKYSLNDSGHVVGNFYWNSSQMIDISISANGINNKIQIVGSGKTSNGETHAYLWQNGEVIDLGTLGGDWSIAYDINEQGQIVGESKTSNGETHATLWIYTDAPVAPSPPSAPSPPVKPSPPSAQNSPVAPTSPSAPTAPVRPSLTFRH